MVPSLMTNRLSDHVVTPGHRGGLQSKRLSICGSLSSRHSRAFKRLVRLVVVGDPLRVLLCRALCLQLPLLGRRIPVAGSIL